MTEKKNAMCIHRTKKAEDMAEVTEDKAEEETAEGEVIKIAKTIEIKKSFNKYWTRTD